MQAAPDPGVTLTDCMQGFFTALQIGIKSLFSPLPFWMKKKIISYHLYIINYFLICSKEKATSEWKVHSLTDWSPQNI